MQDIYSMTGFGRSETVTDEYRVLVELRAVNHRYLDLSLRIPRRMNCFEARLRAICKEYMQRGKVELFVSFEDYTEKGRGLRYNKELAEEYVSYFRQMADDFGIRNDIGTSVLARCPDVFTMENENGDEERLFTILEPVLRKALSSFMEARAEEGGRLRDDLLQKLSGMEALVEAIEVASPSVAESYRERLIQKINETFQNYSIQIDEQRILTETAIFADKICTDEEMVRLRSHIGAMRDKLSRGGACGRELDFIAQEMNREANTTLSKAGSLKIADAAIALKSEIEKIREQVQNIE